MTGQLLPEHVKLLAAGAIPAEVALAAGAYSVTRPDGLSDGLRWDGPGIVFMHHPLDGAPVPQYRPDTPSTDTEGRTRKYLFPKGPVPLNIVPVMVERIPTASTVLLTEGTKQTLCAVAHAPSNVLVVGMSGVYGYSRDGSPNPELGRLVDGRDVVVTLDADSATNPQVHQAGSRLADALEVLGASSVRFLKLPASEKTGLDDFLATVPDPAAVLGRLMAKAGKLGRKPKATVTEGDEDRFFDRNGLRVTDLVAAVRETGDFAVSPDGAVWGYSNGVYVDCEPITTAVASLLGNRYRDAWLRNATTVLVDELRRDGAVLGDNDPPGLVNVRTGMLRIATGELEPHDPAHLSRCQLPIDWDPTATCPTFDTWLTDRCGTQADDFLEAAGLMLCPWIGQRRVVFLFGPARSGKSTLLRMLEALVGRHRSAVTLHDLSTNRFASASLYGAMLNVAGDLSDHHVDDLSTFKLVTGDDAVSGERKFRDAFVFHNTALFVFSANQPPTVSETSRAYLARVRPFLFPYTLEGAEDQAIEARLLAELPGVLVRLVEGARRWLDRGGYGIGDQLVADEFAQASDVAAQFATQVLAAHPGGFVSGSDVFGAYTDWAAQNGRGRLGRTKFLARAENTLGSRQRAHGLSTGPTGWRDWTILPASEWVDPHPVARVARVPFTSPREGIEKENDGGSPSNGEVGPTRATRATPEPAPDDPDEIIELSF